VVNIFATVLTYPAPSANYRGESELNRAVIQKVTHGRFEYPIISPEAIRNALREILAGYGLPNNRTRLNDEEQLAVKFEDFPWPDRYADDFLFGYLVADRKQIPADTVKARGLTYKRDSVLRMNMAKGLSPYRHDALLTQSPLTVKNLAAPWQNANASALLHRETVVTAFQYPFALNVDDFKLADSQAPLDGVSAPEGSPYTSRGEQRADWLRHLLKAISELNGVAGNHARSYFEMAPASIVIRVTSSLVAGYDLYAFAPEGKQPEGSLPEIVGGILHGDTPAQADLPGSEFLIGGKIVRDLLDQSTQDRLAQRGVALHRTPQAALDEAARRVSVAGFLQPQPVGGA
jgi:CRISPR-associated protein Cst2